MKELVYYDLLPLPYLKEIPRTNLHRWKNDDYNRYKGSELNDIASKHGEAIRTVNHYPKMFYAYVRLVKTLIDVVATVDDFNLIVRNSKEKVVDAIIRTKDIIPITKAVKIFNISRHTFYNWVIDSKLKCEKSFFNKCNRIYSGQVMPKEVLAVKNALLDTTKSHWSIRSIHLLGIRNGSISVSENTMYKINKELGIRKTRDKARKKKRYKQGIRAEAPNRIWHADITTLKTLDNQRYYIYLLMDNYSRKILSYAIKERVSGLITKELIETAYQKAKKRTKNLNVTLIVDGGRENNNIHVNNFISQSSINMSKLIALKDIDYSNSMIESVNKTLKYHYLFPEKPENKEDLIRVLEYFIKDYNQVRPLGQLLGLTPDEAWRGMKMDKDYRTNVLKKARIERLAYNKENRCSACEEMR